MFHYSRAPGAMRAISRPRASKGQPVQMTVQRRRGAAEQAIAALVAGSGRTALQRRVADMIEAAPRRTAIDGFGSQPVQRKMGMEMEVGRRVTTANGAALPSDTNLLDHPFFTVVSDKRTTSTNVKYSNLEFVMKAFDQLAGDQQAASTALTQRLDAIKAFYDEIYVNDNERPLSALQGVGPGPNDTYKPVAKDPNDATAGTWDDARIAPRMGHPAALPDHDSGQNKGALFCHFTVGYPLNKMYQALTYLAGVEQPGGAAAASPRLYMARDRAQEAIAVADSAAQQNWAANLSHAEQDELKGAVALLYTQLAAFAVNADASVISLQVATVGSPAKQTSAAAYQSAVDAAMANTARLSP